MFPAMDSSPNPNSGSEILHEFLFFNVLKDGRVNVFSPPTEIVPPADDPVTGVKIKDVQISPNVSARIFLPQTTPTSGKLAVVLYVHGGGFCMCSAFSVEYTRFCTILAAEANSIVVSVEYGLFPSRPIPACYEDSWEALRWVTSGASDPWIEEHGDLRRLFLAGDSAGANICHTLAVRAGTIGLGGMASVVGMVLIHPYFGEDDRMWMYMCPGNEGPRDRRMKAAAEDLARIGCGRVVVMVAEKDVLREAGVGYAEELGKSGWKGTVELVENRERDHCFHLSNHQDEEAAANVRRIASFIQK